MSQKSGSVKEPAEKVVQNIRRATRKRYSAEEKIRIVLAFASQALADLLEREIRFVGHQPKKSFLVRQKLGRRMAMHRHGLDAAGLALARYPFDRRRCADLEPLRSGARRTAGFDSVDQALAQI